MKYFVVPTTTTLAKIKPVQSKELTNEPKSTMQVKEGAKLEIRSLVVDPKTGHVKVTLVTPSPIGSLVYFFRPHVKFIDEMGALIERIPVVESIDILPKKPDAPKTFTLHGYKSVFNADAPVVTGGQILWKHVTHDLQRIPKDKNHINNLLTMVKKVEPWFDKLNIKPTFTSIYRPEPYNSRAGGSSQSRHKDGRAIDFWVPGKSNKDLYLMFKSWDGGAGVYSHDRYILHLDIDKYRRWGLHNIGL
jgi:hypothetical protein